MNDISRFIDSGASASGDVPEHVNESVNPYEPWTPGWYDWFGGSVPSGIFGPGATSCDLARAYLDALALCCSRSPNECDPTTTGVLYLFINDACEVEDAICYTVSDGVAQPPPGFENVWSDIIEAITDWLSGDPEVNPGIHTPIAEIYRGRDNRWTSCAPMPGPRQHAQGVWSSEGRAILYSGHTPETSDCFSVDVYDPHHDSWARVRPRWATPPLPSPEEWAQRRDRVEGSARSTGSAWRPSTNPVYPTWERAVALADGRVLLSLAATDGNITTSLNCMALLDPVALSFGEPIQSRHFGVGRPGVSLPDGRLAVRSWASGAERLLTWSSAGGWRKGPELPGPGGDAMAALGDGRVVMSARNAKVLFLVPV